MSNRQRVLQIFAQVATNLALVAVAVLIALVIAEGLLRLTWKGFYIKDSKGYAQPHVTRAWENRPSVQTEIGDVEYSTVVTHNSLGFRGPEVPATKPPGKTRILLLGDSFAYGMGVQDGETFAAQLEAIDPRLEVINTGNIGYDTGQELLLLQEQGLGLHPDIVLLAYFANDVGDGWKRGYPAFTLDGDLLRYPPPRSAEDPPLMPWPSPRRQLLRHSYVYRFISDRMHYLRWRFRVALGTDRNPDEVLVPEEYEPAWRRQNALLREVVRVVRANGAEPLVIGIPLPGNVEEDVKLHSLPEEAYGVPARLAALAAEGEVPVFDLTEPMRSVYLSAHEQLFYHKDRHFTARGHHLAAQLIDAELERRGLVH